MNKTLKRQMKAGYDRPSFGSLNNLKAYGAKVLRGCPIASGICLDCRLAGVPMRVSMDRTGTVKIIEAGTVKIIAA